MAWYIKVNGSGAAVGHIDLPTNTKPLTVAKGDKVWFKPATLTKPTPGAYQTLSGPVYDIDAGTITYTANDVSLADAKASKKAELAALRYDEEIGGITVGGVSIL